MNPERYYLVRVWKSRLMLGLCVAALLVALVPLLSIILEVFARGLGELNWHFLTAKQVGETSEGGGIGNAVMGSVTVVGLAALYAIPVGILAGIYLSEFGSGRVANTIRFFADVFANFPSIVIGLFALIVFVPVIGHKAIGAAAFALGVLMLPLVCRTTEEALRLVPDSLREAGHALGVPGWRVTLQVTLSTGRAGVITGAMLAIARSFGETAPLIMTLGASTYFAESLSDPSNALTTIVYNGAPGVGAYSNYLFAQRNAWGAAALLLLIVLSINIIVRFVALRKQAKAGGAV